MIWRKWRLPPRARPRFVLLLLSFCVGISILYSQASPYQLPSAHERFNFLVSKGPAWLARHPQLFWPDHPEWNKVGKMPDLQAATWPGLFAAPQLRPLSTATAANEPPALLMLHVFSMPTAASRRRRDLIRRHSPLMSIPNEYRYLVELKFVLGRVSTNVDSPTAADLLGDLAEEEEEILREEAEYGDLIQLDGLVHGENMNDGKTLVWARWVGRKGGREAQWVMKCDDDTLPILPNLLPRLLALDPYVPTYIGSASGRWPGYAYYFEGMIYGFNWGVIKSLATAKLDPETQIRHYDEDAYTGLLMYNLPSKPGLSPAEAERMWQDDRSNGGPSIPPSPDPRTGLLRVDLGTLAGPADRWWIARARKAVAWHPLKCDEAWLHGLEEATAAFQWDGAEYIWSPPSALAYLASTAQRSA